MARDIRPAGRRGPPALWLGLAAAVAWVVLWITALRPGDAASAPALLTASAFAVPLVLIGIATMLGTTLQRLRAEIDGLHAEAASLRDAEPETAPSRPEPASPKPQPARLPQGRRGERIPEIDLATLIRALHFPETADDTSSLRALARALRDPKAAPVVQAAQDVLTLLGQDGVYVDDLTVQHHGLDTWRDLAGGETTARLGKIADTAIVEACRKRLHADSVFRDTVHHFLRRFDQFAADIIPDLDDTVIEALRETRSAHAFVLMSEADTAGQMAEVDDA